MEGRGRPGHLRRGRRRGDGHALPAGLGGLRWIAAATLAGLIVALLAVSRVGPARVARRLPERIARVVRGLGEGAAVLARRRDAAAAVGLQLVAVCCGSRAWRPLRLRDARPGRHPGVRVDGAVRGGRDFPGNVGVRDAALVPALVATGPPSAEPALAFSLGIQATALGVSLLGAAVALLLMRLQAVRAAPALR